MNSPENTSPTQPETNDTPAFSYTYSAREQAEIKKIREKYTPPSAHENRMERLRRLDKQVTVKGQIVSLTMGIVGVLLMGAGMSLALLYSENLIRLTIGIILGVIGIAILSPAYYVYEKITSKEKERVSAEILRLLDELEQEGTSGQQR